MRVSALIGGLRQYALAGSGHHPLTLIGLPTLVQGIIDLQAPPLAFQFEVDLEPATITAAEPPLAMVLRNLVANAIKHHDRVAGAVRISARPCEGHGRVEFVVEDDGPGIEPRLRDRVFDMFESFGPGLRPVGDGIGLALVRRTVTAHGGRIWLAEPAGPGAAGRGPATAAADQARRGVAVHFTWPNQGGPAT
jgi:signal transduction histidine kinase